VALPLTTTARLPCSQTATVRTSYPAFSPACTLVDRRSSRGATCRL
jgi:hypothetical protein